MKRVFIIHGWERRPDDCWFPWLRKKLEEKGVKVFVPAMPHTETPRIDEWVPFLKKIVGVADENTFFVGHSVGCQAILRYLQGVDAKVGGVVFVAGWVHLEPKVYESESDKEIARSWLEIPIDWKKVRANCDKFVAIFSTDDPFVPLSDSAFFEEMLGARIIILEGMGHFDPSSGVRELPDVLGALEEIE